MKTKSIILFVIVSVIAISCQRSDMFDKPSKANLFISLMVDSGTGTRTDGSVSDPATDEEKKFSSVRLFLVKCTSTGTPVASTPVVEIGKNDITLDGTSVNASISTTNGDYQLLYVLANCPSTLSIAKDDYDSFIGSYSQTVSNLSSIWSDDNFFMVNSVDYNSGTGCHNGGVLVDFSNQTISVSVTMERLAAKITAGQDKMIDFSAKLQKVYGPYDDVAGEYTDYVISSARIDAWALMNCVNSFYLIQKYATDEKDFHRVHGSTTDVPDVIVTPSSASTYPVAKIHNSNPNDDFKSAGYYYTNPAFTGFDSDVPTYSELEFVDAGETLYCLENNPSYFPSGTFKKNNGTNATPAVSDSKMKGRCTAVIFRAQILLADGFDADAYTGSHNGTDPVADDPDGPDNWDIYPTRAYNTAITKTIYMYKGKYYADLTRLKEDFSDALGTCADDNASLRAAGVSVYERGYMYYTYYVTKTDIDGCHVPYYCVERNKSYKLTVKAVSGLGDDLPCNFVHYDPEDPVDMAIPKLKVTADVLPWNVKDPVEYEIK